MAIVIDATVGGLNSNSYLTLERASQLADTMPHMGEWLTDTLIYRSQLLVHATRMMDMHFTPRGRLASDSQALKWPQSGLYYHNTTVAIPSSIIPLFVEYATIEWAWALYQNPDPYGEIAPGIRELDTPSYRMEFTSDRQRIIPRAVTELMQPYADGRVTSSVRLVRT